MVYNFIVHGHKVYGNTWKHYIKYMITATGGVFDEIVLTPRGFHVCITVA